MDKIKYVRTFTKQFDKRQGKKSFEQSVLGQYPVKEKCHRYTKYVVVDDDADRGFKPCRPWFYNGLQGHNKYADKYQQEAAIGKVELIGAGKTLFEYIPCQLHAHEELETTAKKGVQHNES